MSDNKSIKFPEKHYVGFQSRPGQDEVPLGFMTPFGTDKAFEKRKTTVDNWAAGNYYGQKTAKLPAQTFDNKPMIGFKLGRNVRHGYGWGQGNVKWRIEDPRGFELEITSPNLAQIMGFCSIEKGEIQEECVWARMGAENILVPVNSDVYESAIKNTARMSKSVSLKDLKIGDSVVMHNGDQGIYYGTYYVVSRKRNYNSPNQGHELVIGDKKRHVFLMQGADGLTSQKFFKAIGSPKLSQVFEGTAMTHQDAERDIAAKVRDDNYSLHESSHSYNSPIAFTIEKMDLKNFTIERIDDTVTNIKARKSNNTSFYYTSDLIFGACPIFNVNNEAFYIDFGQIFNAQNYLPGGTYHHQLLQHQAAVAANPHYYRSSKSYTEVEASKIINDPQVDGTIQVRQNSTRYSSRYGLETTIEVTQLPDDFYYFRWIGKTAAGTVVTCYI